MGEANRRGTFEDRKKFREEARAARAWRLNTPMPKNFAELVFDEPVLDLTDELYSKLVKSAKFSRLTKENFDYLRSQNIFYDTTTNTFFSGDKNRVINKKFEKIEIPQVIDFAKKESLVKTCEISVHSDNNGTGLVDEIVAFVAQGGKIKDILDLQDLRPKKKRIKPKIKAATNFAFLKEIRDQLDKKKPKRFEDLKIVDFNDTELEGLQEVRSVDPETGELLTFAIKGKGKTRKFVLKSSISPLQERFALRKAVSKLFPQHRISKCGCCVQRKNSPLDVYKSREYNTISVSNLQSCGSPWSCAVCAAKVTERRRTEVIQAIADHLARGGSISFVTRTVPHTRQDSLESQRDRYRVAGAYMRNMRPFRRMKIKIGYKGDIRVYEGTVGWINGWHLHIHELFFHEPDAFEGAALASNPAYVEFMKNFEDEYYECWRTAALKAGFDEPSREHGLQIQNGDFAAEYIAKWGIEPEYKWSIDSELTKAHIKKSREGFSPFDLQRAFRDSGDERLIPIIQEFGNVMFGEQQLKWSKGLKASFGIGEVSDEELAEKLDDDAEQIGQVCPEQWKFIVKKDLMADFYLFAAKGWDVLTEFLMAQPNYPPYSLYREPDENSPF